jgi:hypothetical protein
MLVDLDLSGARTLLLEGYTCELYCSLHESDNGMVIEGAETPARRTASWFSRRVPMVRQRRRRRSQSRGTSAASPSPPSEQKGSFAYPRPATFASWLISGLKTECRVPIFGSPSCRQAG